MNAETLAEKWKACEEADKSSPEKLANPGHKRVWDFWGLGLSFVAAFCAMFGILGLQDVQQTRYDQSMEIWLFSIASTTWLINLIRNFWGNKDKANAVLCFIAQTAIGAVLVPLGCIVFMLFAMYKGGQRK